ncbi:TRAP transporter small permease [Marinimicrococcus flavescens]|uniref:TRAP transporter small permease protein n=1 Tax=Marinimicrococcus flavescens TaxID=3031815 RepID=A0AAP3XSF9_9PROT|nr:TRAP transporter small permease [Marinimicrococcus flavescens]
MAEHGRPVAENGAREHHAPEFDEEQTDFRMSELGIEDGVTFVLFWILATVVFVQFFTRYVLNDSLAWTEEVARYLLIAVTFLGATIAVKKNTHIHVEFFYRYLKGRASRTLATAVDVVRLLLLGYFIYLSWKILNLMGNQRMASIDLPIGLLYWVVLAGFAIMFLRAIQVTWRHWRQGYSDLEKTDDAPRPTT